MKFLLPYQSIIYDAQCFVYYCLDFSELINEVQVPLTCYNSELIQKITEYLVSHYGKRIITIEKIYQEISKSNLTASIIKEFIETPLIRAKIGWKDTEDFPFVIALNLMRKLDKKIRGLQGKPWLKIESFQAEPVALQRVKDWYNSLVSDLRMIELMRSKRNNICYPGDNDVHLVLFSLEKRLPLVTNDRHFIDFKVDLEENNFCHKIVPFLDIKLE